MIVSADLSYWGAQPLLKDVKLERDNGRIKITFGPHKEHAMELHLNPAQEKTFFGDGWAEIAADWEREAQLAWEEFEYMEKERDDLQSCVDELEERIRGLEDELAMREAK
jgi:hypothetical protein